MIGNIVNIIEENYFKNINRPYRAAGYYFNRKKLETRVCKEQWFKDKKDFAPLRAFIINRIWEFLCGYGEKPWRVIRAGFLTILLCAISYHFIWGGPVAEGGVKVTSFLDSLYFSGVTFTTLGFGDLTPDSIYIYMRYLAFIEALFGAFLMALLVVVLARKMIR